MCQEEIAQFGGPIARRGNKSEIKFGRALVDSESGSYVMSKKFYINDNELNTEEIQPFAGVKIGASMALIENQGTNSVAADHHLV